MDKFQLSGGTKKFDHYGLMKGKRGREAEAVDLMDIRLTDSDLLIRQLRRYFHKGLKMTDNGDDSKALAAAESFSRKFMGRGSLSLKADLFRAETFDLDRQDCARVGYADQRWNSCRQCR